MKATKEMIVRAHSEGLTVAMMKEKFGYNTDSYIYQVFKEYGLKANKDNGRKHEDIRRLRAEGYTCLQIAEMLGKSKGAVKQICRTYNWKYCGDKIEPHNKGTTDINWQKRVDDKFDGEFEVVSVGQADADSERKIEIRCRKCGTIKSIHSTSLRQLYRKNHCVVCARRKRQKDIEIEREQRETERWLNQKHEQIEFKFCKCGQLVDGRKYCKACAKEALKARLKLNELKRYGRIRANKKDNDITLERLYKRDNGVCYLCGGKCDYSDGIWKDNIFRVGKKYPSIEHIVPLSKGGTHTWDNVKLAHISCNSRKNNRPLVKK